MYLHYKDSFIYRQLINTLLNEFYLSHIDSTKRDANYASIKSMWGITTFSLN
jgi:hypothetical protein